MTEINKKEFINKFRNIPGACSPERLFNSIHDLILIDSPSGREKDISFFLEMHLRDYGFHDIYNDAAGNLIAEIKGGNDSGAGILLTAHMDTVSSFSGKREIILHENGKVSEGSGLNLGADDKCGIGLMLEILALKEIFLKDLRNLKVIFTVSEERGWAGARAIDGRVLEHTGLVISADVPVRHSVSANPHIVVYHLSKTDPILGAVIAGARINNLPGVFYNQKDGYIGGDATVFYRRGLKVIDFCSGAVKQHTSNEYFIFPGLVMNCNWMLGSIVQLSKYDKGFFGYPHPLDKTGRLTKAMDGDFLTRLVTSPTESLIQGFGNFNAREQVLCLGELRRRAGSGGCGAVEKGLEIISAVVERSYCEDIIRGYYNLLHSIYNNTSMESLQKIVLALLITKLRRQGLGFLSLYGIIKKLAPSITGLLITAFSFKTRNHFMGRFLDVREYGTYASILAEHEKWACSGWNSARCNILAILSQPEIDLSAGAVRSLFKSSLGHDAVERTFINFMFRRGIDLIKLAESENGRRGTGREFIIKFFMKIYSKKGYGDLRVPVIKLLGDAGRQSSANFIFNIFVNNEKDEQVIDAVIKNSKLLLEKILRLYKKDPAKGSILLKRIRFNIEGIEKRMTSMLHGDISVSGRFMDIAKMVDGIMYGDERAAGSDIFIILSMTRTVKMLSLYSVRELLRVASIIKNISDTGKRRGVFEIFSMSPLMDDENLFNYLIEAETLEVENVKCSMKEGLNIQAVSELLFGSLKGCDVESPAFRKKLFEEVKGDVKRHEFDRLMDYMLANKLPEPPITLPEIVVSGEKSEKEISAVSIIDELNFAVPESDRRYDAVFQGIIEQNLLGKKNGNRMYSLLKEAMGCSISGIEGFKSMINAKKWPDIERIYRAIVPLLLEMYSNEKKEAVKEVLFMIFLEMFDKTNPDLYDYRKPGIDVMEFIKKIITPRIMAMENSLYCGYFHGLKAMHEKELDRIESAIRPLVANTCALSDLRHIYGLRKSALAKEISLNRDIDGLVTMRREIAALNRLGREFFLYEMFLKRICGYKPVMSGNSKDIILRPSKDASLAFRSSIADDCNKGNIAQLYERGSLFYKILYGGRWSGYVSMVLLQGIQDKMALLIDVFNMQKIPVNSERLVDQFISAMTEVCRANGIDFLLSGSTSVLFSNKDYIRKAVNKYYVNGETKFYKNMWVQPEARFQSCGEEWNVIWKRGEAQIG